MTHVRIKDAVVDIPIYTGTALRLFKVPSFRAANIGASAVSRNGSLISIRALEKLSIELSEGDRVCVLGLNGAGKSTLLRLVAGIYPLSSGTIDIRGEVYPLLDSASVLNSEATGYENIDLVAELNNWPKATIDASIRDIEGFTELGDYLALPVRVYSAGMLARLTFALATMQSPEILLIDEGIGAGDADFRIKAQARMQRFVGKARIILLATHSLELCRSLCNRALVLSRGANIFFGDLEDGISHYQNSRRDP